jgi:hypothetical protein
MTLEPRLNRYTKYFERIRILQDYSCQQAELHRICRVDNTNMDRTLIILHRVLYNVLKRQTASQETSTDRDRTSSSLELISEEFTKTIEGICGSKEMTRWIHKRSQRTKQMADTVKNIMAMDAWLPSVDEDMLSIEDGICAAIHF